MIRKLLKGKYLTRSLLIIFTAGTIFSCSRKSIAVTELESDENTVNTIDFEYLSIRSKLNVSSTEAKDATVLTRMKKDSVIWFNVSGSLGIQGLRAILTTDSVKILDRVTKEYSRYSYEGLSEKLNFKVDFNLLQSLIVGNIPKGSPTSDRMNPENNKYNFKTTRPGITLTNYIHSELMKPERIVLKENDRLNSLTFDYSGFEAIDDHAFAMHLIAKLVYDLNGLVVEETFDVEHPKVEFTDKPLKFPFNVPNKYDSR